MIKLNTYELKPLKKIFFDTFGGIAVSSLLLCVISGIILAIPYDVSNPYLSISEFVLSNAGAVVARNMHYWSAQFFLIFSLLHIWDHFRIGSEKYIRTGIWFRLGLAVFVIFFAMLSGFVLKADSDSLQALQIFRSLLEDIPLAGKYVAYALLGAEGQLQLLYINHIASATIFIIVILFEHARLIWGKSITFIVLGLLLLVFSLFFQAPLHDNLSALVKGPWYFLGLQEMLHWMSRPGLIWIVILLAALPVFVMPYLNNSRSRIAKYFLLIALLFYAVLTIIGYFFRGEDWKWDWKASEVYNPFKPLPIMPGTFNAWSPKEVSGFGRNESCMICHEGMKGFSVAHDPEAIGCVSCHLGNPFSPDKDQAHAGMLRVPGNLENAARSCGTADCHPDITSRINTTLMTSMSGIIAVDMFVFNEAGTPDGHYSLDDIGYSPAGQHLRNLCTRCHLGNPKDAPAPLSEESRGGGCNACHLNYSEEALKDLEKYFQTSMDTSLWTFHPSLDLNISNDHCFGCHSRSGRISTSYEGWHETVLEKGDVVSADSIRVLEDGRVFRYIAEDVHHTAGMLCIDCHDSYELMGDGTYYMHEEDQVQIGCEDCHFSHLPAFMYARDLDVETQKILQLKGLEESSVFLPLGNSGRLIWNSVLGDDGRPFLVGKLDGKTHPLAAPAGICSRGDAHQRLSCEACHTAWVPQCIGCHNEYDPFANGYDMIKRKEEQGSWVEYVAKYLAGLPALGIIEDQKDDAKGRIHTFTPGMILSIDKGSYDADVSDPYLFHRLYAPISSHTTVSSGRSCRSCHNDPLAIGYGRGVLKYEIRDGSGKWYFVPRFANNPNDGLPEDAWIAFLMEPTGTNSTRTNTRPFSLEEQKKILLVGACLECHDEDSELMLSTLDDFDAVLKRRSLECVLPEF